jgi:ribosomal protein L29
MLQTLKEKTEKELIKMLEEARTEVRKFRFGFAGAGKKNPKDFKVNKKLISQVLTELNNRK